MSNGDTPGVLSLQPVPELPGDDGQPQGDAPEGEPEEPSLVEHPHDQPEGDDCELVPIYHCGAIVRRFPRTEAAQDNPRTLEHFPTG